MKRDCPWPSFQNRSGDPPIEIARSHPATVWRRTPVPTTARVYKIPDLGDTVHHRFASFTSPGCSGRSV